MISSAAYSPGIFAETPVILLAHAHRTGGKKGVRPRKCGSCKGQVSAAGISRCKKPVPSRPVRWCWVMQIDEYYRVS